eukprot:808567-Lingulodinium_polyedra.AAC.1
MAETEHANKRGNCFRRAPRFLARPNASRPCAETLARFGALRAQKKGRQPDGERPRVQTGQ